jgi:putative copper export protein
VGSYYLVLTLHILGAAVWVGGHLTLALTILPRALELERATIVTEFEQRFERIGLPALAVQVLTGLWLAEHLLGSPEHWLEGSPIARVVQVKLGLLVFTLALAAHARLRVLPKLSNATLRSLAWHIRLVTIAAVLFVLAGVSIRFGGYPLFER